MNVGEAEVDLADGRSGGSDADHGSAPAWRAPSTRSARRSTPFNDAATTLYRFFLEQLCDWYVELAGCRSAPMRTRGAQDHARDAGVGVRDPRCACCTR
jgi:hypothetical protein